MMMTFDSDSRHFIKKERKKEYRKEQRRSIFTFEESKNKNVEKLFQSNNKDDFWKSISSYRNTDEQSSLNEYEKKELADSIKELF